jgi:hypothetical protein
VVSEDAAAHIVALVKHELELQTKITPERKQYLEGAMNRLQDIAIEFFARYAAHMSKS